MVENTEGGAYEDQDVKSTNRARCRAEVQDVADYIVDAVKEIKEKEDD